MDADLTRLLGLTGSGGRERAPAPTAESVAQWKRLYEEAGSVRELARILGKNPGTIRYHLRRHGIPTRRTGFRSPRTVASVRGADHFNWKGGTYRHSNGYVYEYAPDHPAAGSAKGYVLQHRLVMERHLGRPLTRSEIIHHRNEDKADNRIENLALTTRSPHMRMHKKAARRDGHGRFA